MDKFLTLILRAEHRYFIDMLISTALLFILYLCLNMSFKITSYGYVKVDYKKDIYTLFLKRMHILARISEECNNAFDWKCATDDMALA